jgi:3-methylcrotonyl-CoA carboxylase beta subunit
MVTLHSSLDQRSEEYRGNVAAMRALVEDLREKTALVSRGGSEDWRAIASMR